MATKKKTTKTTSNANKSSMAPTKKAASTALADARAEAIEHESAGRWAEAAAAWTRIQPLFADKADRKEAAGRAEAARVRASAKPTEEEPLDEQLARNPTAQANATGWDNAVPEPGYVPPPGTGDEGAQGRDDGAHDDGAIATTGGSTGEPGADDAAPTKAGRAPRERNPRLPPTGTVLVKRDRHGAERARCTIVDGGVEYAGKVFKSISASAIAAATDLGLGSMTQDGYAFWQLKAATRSSGAKKDPVDSLQKAWERYHERVVAIAKNATDESRAKVNEAINQHITALNMIAAEVA